MFKRIFKAVIRNIKLLFQFIKIFPHKHFVPNCTVNIFFDHMLGGGTELYSKNFLKNSESEYLCITNYRIFFVDMAYKISYKEYEFVLMHSMLKTYLEKISISSIYINSLVSYSKVFEVIDIITNIYKKKTIPITIAFHDYFPICKCYNLFCNHKNCTGYCKLEYVNTWRLYWKKLFDVTTELRIFSNRSKQILNLFIPEYLSKVNVVPHSMDYIKEILPIEYSDKSINIGVMGDITSEIKGAYVLKELINNFVIHIFGTSNFSNKNLIQHGRYSIDSIRNLLIANNINLMLFISISEETFSYVTSEIIALGLPIICFDIGAQSEKVRNYDKGIVVKDIDEMKSEIKTFLKRVEK